MKRRSRFLTGAKKETPCRERPARRPTAGLAGGGGGRTSEKETGEAGKATSAKRTTETKALKGPSPLEQLVHVFFFAFSLCFHMGFVIFPSSHIGSLHSVSMVSSKARYSR